jgi:hypothetical protein
MRWHGDPEPPQTIEELAEEERGWREKVRLRARRSRITWVILSALAIFIAAAILAATGNLSLDPGK